jgi:UrcA family protein
MAAIERSFETEEVMLKKLVGALALMAAPFVLASAAHANAVRVSYADLDLGQPQGRAELDSRLMKAARSVCRSDVLEDYRFSGACRRSSLADARAKAEVAFAMQQQGHARLAAK